MKTSLRPQTVPAMTSLLHSPFSKPTILMETVDIEYIDRDFTVSGSDPTTPEEMLTIFGTEQAVIEEVVSNLRYRNKYPRVYKAVSADLEKGSDAFPAFPRAVVDKKTKADKTEVDVHESVMDHIRAFFKGRPSVGDVAAVAPAENAKEILQGLFQTYETSEPLFKQGERTGAGAKVSASALAAANDVIAKGNTAAVVTYIESTVPGYKI